MGRLEALLRRCQSGDHEALEELVRTWERQLFYYLRRLVKDEPDAWDVLQQAWSRVLRGIPHIKDPDKLVPWLYTVARNTALSHRQSLLSREKWVDREAAIEDLANIESRDTDITAEELHTALANLPTHQREALTLFFLEDFSIDQMSQILTISEGTVKSRLFYAKRALREILEKTRSRT